MQRFLLPAQSSKPLRVCDQCYDELAKSSNNAGFSSKDSKGTDSSGEDDSDDDDNPTNIQVTESCKGYFLDHGKKMKYWVSSYFHISF